MSIQYVTEVSQIGDGLSISQFWYIGKLRKATLDMQCFLKQKLPIDIKSKYSSVAFSLLLALRVGFFQDLKSTNVVAKSTALNVICSLVDAEKIPPLLPFIVAALKDKR
jgi:hypothetical protein